MNSVGKIKAYFGQTFGFCPQLACGQPMDNSVDSVWKICREAVDNSPSPPQLIPRINQLFPSLQLVPSLIRNYAHSLSRATQRANNRFKIRQLSTYPRYPQHPLLPLPYSYISIRKNRRG